MEKDILISVIVPVYNVENYLKRCIESIQTQSYTYIEIILIDDGSTDLSGEYCNQFAKLDDRIKVIHQNNMGLSAARNAGLEIAQGQWISFVDSDDFIHPQMLKTLLDAALHTKSKVAVCGFTVVDEKGTYISSYKPKAQILKGEAQHRYFFEEGKGKEYMCNKLFASDLLKIIRFPVGKIYEDTFVLPKVLEAGGRTVFIELPAYYYTKRISGLSGGLDIKEQMSGLEAKISKLQFMEQYHPALVPKARQEILEACCWLLYKIYAVKGNDFNKNKKQVLNVFRQEKKRAEKHGILVKSSVLLITLSPWLFVKLYGLYLKFRS